MSNRKRTLIFLNLMITSFSASLLATAMVIALPHITNDLKVSLGIQACCFPWHMPYPRRSR